ncbi:rhomboid family intramembrane serine protease [Nocardia sp. CDC159]|uniref:Rhomboid family intramembrane serine protease n=1 Tax=Nocardia pulmonis TaxID=2951408 RepID=A0A9X2ECJ1_9NOCA|nr:MULTISPECIES: rhomboid family intramembrane serine protease [Nocardia]MCM6778392.1 rhomboid family intramembrane serine protease [Nocardia pulmonis]MCM6791212.1 rhomboid family intramembrane serine protease [Nocardia sp. CDC159]
MRFSDPGDRGVRQLSPYRVTAVLIAVNVVCYLGQLAYPRAVDLFGGIGRGLMRDGELFVDDGRGYSGSEPVGIAHGEWYRLITSGFLHLPPEEGIGVGHLVANMIWLVLLGRVLEPGLGHLRFAVLYLGSVVGGSALAYLLTPDDNGIGASGAVYGLVGCYVVLYRSLGVDWADARGLLVFSVVWLVVSAYITSWSAHLGGLLAGVAIGLVYSMLRPRYRGVRSRPR